jgi:hypothetical protein
MRSRDQGDEVGSFTGDHQAEIAAAAKALYNERPTWLAVAHEMLDAAVLARLRLALRPDRRGPSDASPRTQPLPPSSSYLMLLLLGVPFVVVPLFLVLLGVEFLPFLLLGEVQGRQSQIGQDGDDRSVRVRLMGHIVGRQDEVEDSFGQRLQGLFGNHRT